MRKFALLTAALLFVVGAFAQERKLYVGTSMMLPGQGNDIVDALSNGGGYTTGITYGKKGDEKTTRIGITPDIGMYLSPKLAVGVALGYTHQSIKVGSAASLVTNSYGINPYARMFFPMGDRVSAFIQPGVLYSSSKAGDADATHVFYAGIKPGIEYKLGPKFNFIGHIGNMGYFDYGNSTSAFDFSINMATINLGVIFVL